VQGLRYLTQTLIWLRWRIQGDRRVEGRKSSRWRRVLAPGRRRSLEKNSGNGEAVIGAWLGSTARLRVETELTRREFRVVGFYVAVVGALDALKLAPDVFGAHQSCTQRAPENADHRMLAIECSLSVRCYEASTEEPQDAPHQTRSGHCARVRCRL